MSLQFYSSQVMLPPQFSLAQFISEQYAQAAQFMPMYYVAPNNSEIFWNNVPYQENSINYGVPQYTEFHPVQKFDRPTDTRERSTKPKEKPQKQISQVGQSQQQQSCQSHDRRFMQKYGRNINSNIFHHMLKMIKTDRSLETKLKNVISDCNLQITDKGFFQMLGKKVNKLKAYISFKKMKSIFEEVKTKSPLPFQAKKKQEDFLMALRILCKHYLKSKHILYVYNKLKIKRQSRLHHINGTRKLLELFE